MKRAEKKNTAVKHTAKPTAQSTASDEIRKEIEETMNTMIAYQAELCGTDATILDSPKEKKTVQTKPTTGK